MKNFEQEFKWDAPARQAFVRFVDALQAMAETCIGPQLLQNTDYYLENATNHLAAQKIALRIRQCGENWEATLKTRSAIKNGLACRQEWTQPLPAVPGIRQALKILETQREWHGIALASLKVRFVIKNARTIYRVTYRGCQAEVALDNYLTLAQGHQWRRKEIELELKRGSTTGFEKLAQKLTEKSGLKPAQLSKVAVAEKWILNKFRKD